MESLRDPAANLIRLIIQPIALLRRGALPGLSTLEILLSGFGVVAALVVASLLTPALNQIPGAAGDFAPIGVAILLVPAGIVVALGRRAEVERFLRTVRERTETVTGAMAPRPARAAPGPAAPAVVDTSAVIDGRLADVVESGFLLAELIVPRFVLDELRQVADSSDPLKRQRGRHGLQLLARIQSSEQVRTVIDESDFPDLPDIDAKVLALARGRGAALVTTDYNLHRVAGVEKVRVLNLNALAQAVRTIALPGESLALRIHQEGRERAQGVGFLEDGTMVVVENSRHLIGRDVRVEVSRVIQTAAGRMLFATLREVDPHPEAADESTESKAVEPAEAGQ